MSRVIVVLAALALVGACKKSEEKKPAPAKKEKPSPDAAPPSSPDAAPAPLATVPAHEDPPLEPGPGRPTQIAVGYMHACARMSDDTMRCWGGNDFGQLGDGTLLVATKQATPALTGVVEVSAGYGFTCARLRDRTVRCWGNALDGEIGVASPTDPAVNHSITIPTEVPGLTDAIQIESHLKHSCAVRADGTVWCWGDNTFGQLGNGNTTTVLGPVRVKGLDGVTGVGVGNFNCARRVDGTVHCWGMNLESVPRPVSIKDAVAVHSGAGIACARHTEGTLHCWGANDSGQLGRADDKVGTDIPTAVAGLAGATDAAVADTHVCAVADKQVKCWGAEGIAPFAKECLQLTSHEGGGGGGGEAPGAPADWYYCATPTVVAGIPDPVDVGTMSGLACALTATHEIFCWGAGTATPTAVTL